MASNANVTYQSIVVTYNSNMKPSLGFDDVIHAQRKNSLLIKIFPLIP